MFPTLVQVGPVHVSSYGSFIAIGFALACVLSARAAKRVGVPVWTVLDLCFWGLVAGLLGARFVFAVTHLELFVEPCREAASASKLVACTRVLHVWEGGLSFYGGFIGAALFAIVFARRRGVPFFKLADVIVAPVALAHFFGRMGCFAAGCCYGREAPDGTPGAVAFGTGSLALLEHKFTGRVSLMAKQTAPLYPVQLWEAAAELVLFVVLVAIARRKRVHGQLLALWMIGYAIARFAIEYWRGDPNRGELGPLSTSQAIAVAAAGFGLLLMAALALHSRRNVRARAR